MRNPVKWLAMVLALSACLVVAMSAQKGKPAAYVWSVAIDPASANIKGSTSTFVSNDSTVAVSAGGPCRDCPTSNFQLRISGLDNTDDQPWLALMALPGPTGEPTTPCRYPTFAENGSLQLGSLVERSAACVTDFMSHAHPQLPYRHVLIWISTLDFDIMAMPVDQPHVAYPVSARLNIQIGGPDCLTVGHYSSVAFASPYFNEGTMQVTRLDADKWKVDMTDHPIVVAEWAHSLTVSKRGQASCSSTILKPYVNSSISATLTWKRTLVN